MGGAGRDRDEGRSSSVSAIKTHLIEIGGHYDARSRVLQRDSKWLRERRGAPFFSFPDES